MHGADDHPARIDGAAHAGKSIEEDAEAYFRRGNAYSNLGDYRQAIRDLTRAVSLDPRFGLAYRHRGIAYWMSGDSESSFQDYRRSRELGAGSSEAT